MPIRPPQKIEYPAIAPIPSGIHRPFWSVMIPTYNCANYLVQTLESVLAQDLGPEHMQIEVVDDCSTKDNPKSVVDEIGKGRVLFYQQPHNVGAISNFNTCIQRSLGKWIHILHGDDTVKPGFYRRYEMLIQQYPEASLIFGPSDFMDGQSNLLGRAEATVTQDGIVENFSQKQAIRNWILTPSVVIPRDAYEAIGGFYQPLYHTADWEMFFRVGSYKSAISTVNSYTCYRDHVNSHTSSLVMTGDNIHQGLLAIKICLEKLSFEDRLAVRNHEFMWLSSLARGFAIKLQASELLSASLAQAGWAFRLNPNLPNFKLWMRLAMRYAQQFFGFGGINKVCG